MPPQAYIDEARTFIAANLKQCCKELSEWYGTALLCNGKVREATAIYRNVSYASAALSMAQSEISRQAIQQVARSK